jgi:hypothetical protein
MVTTWLLEWSRKYRGAGRRGGGREIEGSGAAITIGT